MSLDNIFNPEELQIGNYFAITAVRHEYNKPSKLEIYLARYLGIDSFELEDPSKKNIIKYKVKWNPWHNYLVNQIYDYHYELCKTNREPMWLYIDSYRFKYGLDYYVKFDFKTVSLIQQYKPEDIINLEVSEPVKKKRKIKKI